MSDFNVQYRSYCDNSDYNKFLELCMCAEDERILMFHTSTGQALHFSHYQNIMAYVAVIQDRMIGYVWALVLPNEILLPQFIYVCPEYRNKGVGEKLAALLERESGCKSSMIYYEKKHHEHYKHLGFSTGDNLEVAVKNLNQTLED